MVDTRVVDAVLGAARVVVTEGLGEGRRAHGCFIIVGNADEILADVRDDPLARDTKRCRYGDFQTYVDRRSDDLRISECRGERRRSFCHLFHEDGAIIVDGNTGLVCCGGFKVRDLTEGIGGGGARTKAASAMATQAGGCYVVLASEDICGSTQEPAPASAMLKIFNRTNQFEEVPVHLLPPVPGQSFEQWLHPLKFGADLYRYNKDFVEGTRQWILNDVDNWLTDARGSPCKVLLAGPGFGKTTIAARLHHMTTRVLAIHLCGDNDKYRRDPRRMIASIAYQIAEELPQFRDALRNVRNAEGGSKAYELRTTARELADCLLFNPLLDISPPQPVDQGGRRMIIIDALDEAEHDAETDLLDLIAFDFCKLPAWLAVLVTARSEVPIRTRLKVLRPTVLDAEDKKELCNADVHVYLRSILAPLFEDDDSLREAIGKAVAKSDGLFLYLHFMRGMVNFGDDIDKLPIGLAGMYQQQLQRVLGPTGLGCKNKISTTRRVFEAIVAAQVPLHMEEELPGLSGVSLEAVHKLVKKLSLLLPVGDDRRVHIIHKSFVAWLTRDNGFDRSDHDPHFCIDLRDAHHRLASACGVQLIGLLQEGKCRCFKSDMKAVKAIRQFLKARSCRVENSPAFDEYVRRWSITHFVKSEHKEVGLSLLSSLGFLIKRALQMDTLIADALLLLPDSKLLHRALLLAQNHLPLGEKIPGCANWLAEEVWQRLLHPAKMGDADNLKQLTLDAREMARADLMFSARHAHLTPADSYLHCVLEGHNNSVNAVTTFDADDHTWVASCSDDKTVRIWNPMKGGSAIHLLEGHSRKIHGVKAFNDAKGRTRVASFSYDFTVHIWDPIKGELIRVLEGHERRVNDVTACVIACVDTNRQTWLASCSDDRSVRIWNAMNNGDESPRVLKGRHGHKNRVLGVAFVEANGQTLVVSCSFDKTLRVWKACDWDASAGHEQQGGNRPRVLVGHTECVNCVTAFVGAYGTTWVASCSDDKTVRIWDPMNGTAVHVLGCQSDWVNDVTAIVDPGYTWVVASCSEDETVCVWGAMDHGKVHKVLEGHSRKVRGLTDNKVRIWDAIKGSIKAVHVLEGHFGKVNGLTAFKHTNDDAWVASCSSDRTVRIWDSMKGSQGVRVAQGHSRKVKDLTAFTDAEGKTWVASCSDDTTVRIWDPIKGGEAMREPMEHPNGVHGVTAFNVERRTWLATCSETIRIWDTTDFGHAPRTRHDHNAHVKGITAFKDTNGKTWLASYSMDFTVRIWDAIMDNEPVHVLKGHLDYVNGVTDFAKGHMWVASCSDDTTIRIWDAMNGTEIHELTGHAGAVQGVTGFVDSNNHAWLVSGSTDTTVRIWDAQGGRLQKVLEGHSATINGVTCINTEGSNTWVASCSDDSTVRIWDVINEGATLCVIPLDSLPTAISTISAIGANTSEASAVSSLLAIGHNNGHVTFWEYMQHGSTEICYCFPKRGRQSSPSESRRVRRVSQRNPMSLLSAALGRFRVAR